MTATYLLATVVGWYLVIVSSVLLFRRKLVTTAMSDIITQPGQLLIVAFLTLIIGLLMVVSHNIWVMQWPVVLTLIAWMTLISGIIRLVCPETAHKLWHNMIAKPEMLTISGIIMLLIGLFLLFKVYF